MANKMLVDAAHPEETRVVVVRGNRVQEFDFESADRKQLRGNIYLAKVTRVEPSLQAAFVDYGGNRHGFLAFSEIHPDYYQIPVADRQALLEAEAQDVDDHDDTGSNGDAGSATAAATDGVEGETVTEPAEGSESDAGAEAEAADGADDESGPGSAAKAAEAASDDDDGDDSKDDEEVDSVGSGDALEELPERRRPRPRQYKVQEVIKRRQVLLVQVVKEERGNKGAALTTYLSLAGRYSVLMPNTARGGGISRKITSPTDRKRMKDVVAELDVPEGMGVILRTAGASRTKAEIKRDFEYLLRLWENVRDLTLESTAPALVYEEGSLIKRSIRDLYGKDIDEVLVAGDDAYREAKDFMRMLMPSHAKNVKPYRDSSPIFARSGIESQLDAMFSPQVTLKSGGYLVINQTEALVAIDVNSGRATREHNIEDTALQTNLEASEEISRQLRLRDLAGLIVIDFIDMEEKRNNRAVEKRLKDSLKSDRARIQVGRISHFGLLEMSRQRIRTGVLESTTTVCPTCQGSGHVRAPASVALHVLRAIEEQLLKSSRHDVIIHTLAPVALYILNQKRAHLSDLEARFGLSITVQAEEAVADGAHFTLERGELATRQAVERTSVGVDSVQPIEEDEPVEEIAAESESENEGESEQPEEGRRRRRRRRRRGGGDAQRNDDQNAAEASETGDDAERAASEDGEAADNGSADAQADGEDGDDQPRKRRRGRRGGRRNRRGRGGDRPESADAAVAGAETAEAQADAAEGEGEKTESEHAAANGVEAPSIVATEDAESDKGADTQPEEPGEAIVAAETDTTPADKPDEVAEPAEPAAEPQPQPEGEPGFVTVDELEDWDAIKPVRHARSTPEPEQPEAAPEPEDDRPKRSGWWQRRSFF